MPWDVLNPNPAADELIAVHAAVLPTGAAGQVVYFGDWSEYETATKTRIFDLDTGSRESLTSGLAATNLFCSGHAFLADGRLLIAGGRIGNGANLPGDHPIHPHHEPGERACWTYEPRKRSFKPAAPLQPQPGTDDQGGGRWYPTLVTLGSGEVFAAAGHPAESDTFEDRHQNHTPERFSPTPGTWTLLAEGAERTSPAWIGNVEANAYRDGYPRYHLTGQGALFCDTLGLHVDGGVEPRSYHPYQAQWQGPAAGAVPDSFYDWGSSATSVLLPLLPSDGYRPRFFAANGLQAYRIDNSGGQSFWQEVPARIGPDAGRTRDNGCAVLLPTGQVALVGGVQAFRTADAEATLSAELYDPGIDWSTETYLDVVVDPSNLGGWVELDGDGLADVARGYHSVALLLPDGSVWTAGSTEVDDSPYPDEEHRQEVWMPPYPDGERPVILDVDATSTDYGAQFHVDVDTPSGDPIERVALIRCGSVTHGFDPDQRYVGLTFSSGAQLTVTAPSDPDVAPPGYYMLWVVDAAGRPCAQASFIRVCEQELDVSLERSTISAFEVAAMGTPATFHEAFFVRLDGFMPHELGDPLVMPEVSLEWPAGGDVDEIEIVAGDVDHSDPTLDADRSQTATIPYGLVVTDDGVFDTVPDTPEGTELLLRVAWRQYAVERSIRLTHKHNPRMNDGPIEWLSTDVRVFKVHPGDTHIDPEVPVGEDPLAFLADLLDRWNDPTLAGTHPFDDLEDEMDESPVALNSHDGPTPVYNFAVARVRMVAPVDEEAEDVRLFFRGFPTWTLGFEYDTATYPHTSTGATAMPGFGILDAELRTIPFFGAAREADLLSPGDLEVNRHTFHGAGADEVCRYFGCWLDFNHNGGVLAQMRSEHPCLAAEIHYPPDPIKPGDTPGTSDNLAQRNLAVVGAPNPAGPTTRVVDLTFTVTGSRHAPRAPGEAGGIARRRARCDELMIDWGNLPPETQATIYWPDVDVDRVLAASAATLGPRVVARVDDHTISCRVGGTTYVPIPGPRTTDIPGLLTLQLPPNLVKGERYRLRARQIEGDRRRVIGTVQLEIPISTAEDLLGPEETKLGVLRWIAEAMAPGDRWRPIFERYLENIAGRVRGMGGNPDAIEPTGPQDTGRRPPRPKPRPPGRHGAFTGRVHELHYDCDGGFEGFVLEDCDERRTFRSCERGLETVLRDACERRKTVTVHPAVRDASRPAHVIVHCC